MVVALFLPIFLLAQAQGTHIILTWRADSFVEPSYTGKALPAPGSRVRVALQLLDGDRSVSVAKNQISWFLDGRLIAKEIGLDSTSFTTGPARAGSNYRIKVFISDFKGTDIQRTIDIPVARPEVSIGLPYRAGELSPGKYKIFSRFYYWNISGPGDLIINWSVYGEKNQSADPAIELEVPENYRDRAINLSISATNPENEYETANAVVNILVR